MPLAVVIVMILSDDPVVTARVGDDLVMAAIELADGFAFAIGRGDDLFVFVGLRILSIGHGQFRFDLDIASVRLNCKRYASLRNFYFLAPRPSLRAGARNVLFGGRLCG